MRRFSTVGDILRQSTELRPKAGQLSPDLWRRVVGPRIAERSRPDRIQGGVLWVQVSSSTWAQELSLHSEMIIGRLREAGLRLDLLRFRVGYDPRSAHKLSRAEAPEPVVERAPLPPELEQRLAQMQDTDLRSVIAEAAALSLGRARRNRQK